MTHNQIWEQLLREAHWARVKAERASSPTTPIPTPPACWEQVAHFCATCKCAGCSAHPSSPTPFRPRPRPR